MLLTTATVLTVARTGQALSENWLPLPQSVRDQTQGNETVVSANALGEGDIEESQDY